MLDTIESPEKLGALSFFFRFFGLVAAVFVAVLCLKELSIWSVPFAFFLVGVPVILPLAIFSNLRQAQRLAQFAEESWIRYILSGVFFRILALSIAVLLLELMALPFLALGSEFSWFLLVSSGPVFWIIHHWFGRKLEPHSGPAFRSVHQIRLSSWTTLVALYVVSVLANIIWTTDGKQVFEVAVTYNSALIGDWFAFAEFASYVGDLGRVEIQNFTALNFIVAFVLGPGSVAVLGVNLAAAAAMPNLERRRVLGRATLQTPPPPVSTEVTAWTAGIATVVIGFVVLPNLIKWDAAVRSLPSDLRAEVYLQEAAEKIEIFVEVIAGRYVRPGTIELVKTDAQEVLHAAQSEVREEIIREINAAADGLKENIDPFLDRYYSLSGEYSRIIKLAQGKLEEELERDLLELLSTGDPTAGLQRLLADRNSSAAYDGYAREVGSRAEAIIAANEVQIGEDEIALVQLQCELPPCLDFETAISQIQLETASRLTKSGLAASSGGLVAALVVKKVVAKGSIKLGAKTLLKIFGSKAAGGLAAGAGAFLGGAVGSIVPVVGTTAGAVVGGALAGLLVGISADAILIELEESFGRDTFKAQIEGAIDEWRAQAIALVEVSG